MKESAEFVQTLLHAATNVHILHWQTKSYAEHIALGEFYTELPELVDQLAEAIMGRYDMTFAFKANYYAPAATGKAELEDLKLYVEKERKGIPQDSEIQNLTDEIAQLIDKTLFLLRFS